MFEFTQGKILPQLLKFMIPILFALFLQTMYGAVDLLIVGQFATSIHVSAVSTGSWLLQLVTSFVVGMAMGTTILLGRKIGENKKEEASDVISGSIFLFALLALLITLFMECFAHPILNIMNTPVEAYQDTLSYFRICIAGSIFIVAYNVLGSIFKGIGNSRIPLLTVFIACICNIGLDLLFVAGFDMGASGAAIATVMAQAISVVLSFFIIQKQNFPFEIRFRLDFDHSNLFRIIKIGFPLAFQDVLVTISFLVITAIVNKMGVTASAGVGVAEKLCGFIMLVPSSFSQTMASFVSQNVGAHNYKRANQALGIAIGCSFMISIFIFYFTFFHGDLLSSLFTHDVDVIEASWQYLKGYAIDCLLTSELFCFVGYLNGTGQTFFILLEGLIGAFGIRIPVSIFMAGLKNTSIFKISLATPCSSFVQILLCILVFIYTQKKWKKEIRTQ